MAGGVLFSECGALRLDSSAPCCHSMFLSLRFQPEARWAPPRHTHREGCGEDLTLH